MNPQNPGNILVIDDDQGPRESLKFILKNSFNVQTASSALEGLSMIEKGDYDVVLMDIKMPGMDGITALKKIREKHPDIQVIMVTAYASVETTTQAMEYGTIRYFRKPWDNADIINAVKAGINKKRATTEQVHEMAKLKELVATQDNRLKITEEMRKQLFNSAYDGIILTTPDGTIIDINTQASAIYDIAKDEIIGSNARNLEPNITHAQYQERTEALLQQKPQIYDTEYIDKAGQTKSLEISAKAIIFNEDNVIIQSFVRDITEKKRLQAQLLQSQKMESLGILAGGLAHDFNNILTQIIGYAELITNEEGVDPSIHSKALIIAKAGIKAHVIVTKLLSFARTGSVEMKLINLNHAVSNTLELLERMLLKKNVQVLFHAAENFPYIKGDINQIEQILVNLMVNASDAMPNGGSITIATTSGKITRNIASPLLLEPGEYAMLRIEDTGTGISGEIRDKIFDPFFTTKGPGKGTGLGLAMSYGIIKAHGGAIDLQSEVGKGTTFNLYFPVVDNAEGLNDDILDSFRIKPRR
jgi:two-component system cell cycle sensor histidine kinase/response regulator CckA